MSSLDFGILKPIQAPSYLDSQTKVANLSQLATQQKRATKQMENEDQEAKHAGYLRKRSVVGNAMESIAGLSPEERKTAYLKVRNELIQSGVASPDQLPPEHDEGYFSQVVDNFRRSNEGVDKRIKTAQLGKLEAETASLAPNAELERRYKESQIAKNLADAKGSQAGKGMEQASTLRKEWTGLPTTKATQDVAQSLERVRNAYANPSAAGDMTLIYSFMKMNDPGSTVREGEFATAQNAAGVPDRIRNQWNQVLKGERLSEEQRHDFASQAEKMYGGQLNAQKTVDDQYIALAQRYGVDPSVVMMKFPEAKELKLVMKKEEEKPGFFARLFGLESAQAKAPASEPPADKPKIVIQNGHSYELNPKTGKYE